MAVPIISKTAVKIFIDIAEHISDTHTTHNRHLVLIEIWFTSVRWIGT